jgi:RimJ/RimL family protein N-acetyltransferase
MRTGRLALEPLDASHIAKMISGDDAALAASFGVRFPAPFKAPPLLGEDLPYFYKCALEQTTDMHWGLWLVSLRETGEVVGAAGFTGPPNADGAVYVGYSVYPHHEGKGYATEAVDTLIDWALERAPVRAVRATIPPWNKASARVAEKLGLSHVGMAHDEEVGEVLVYEMTFPAGTPAR